MVPVISNVAHALLRAVSRLFSTRALNWHSTTRVEKSLDTARRSACATLLFAPLLFADVHNCACDVAKPETLEAHECGLCKAAEQQSAEPPFFYLKDTNPRKPNRWLALPRAHYKGSHPLKEMPPAERTAYWIAAIEKARSLYGNSWGLAVNGEESRTQCHGHIHIGKLLDDVETPNFIVVNGPADIPLPEGETGLWVHPVNGKLHVHTGEQINETVLQR